MTIPTHSADKGGEAGRLTGFTRGEWRVRETKGLWWVVEVELMSINGLPCWYTVARTDFDLAANGYTGGALNPEADAHLIAEAGAVANETGLTPRELAERCAMLEAALAMALRDSGCDGDLCMYQWYDAARSALSRATPPQTEGK